VEGSHFTPIEGNVLGAFVARRCRLANGGAMEKVGEGIHCLFVPPFYGGAGDLDALSLEVFGQP
jgi:hypothetical protein